MDNITNINEKPQQTNSFVCRCLICYEEHFTDQRGRFIDAPQMKQKQLIVQSINEHPLCLKFAYQGNQHQNVTSCAFSKCGRFLAFVDEPHIAVGYSVESFLSNIFYSDNNIDCNNNTDNYNNNHNNSHYSNLYDANGQWSFVISQNNLLQLNIQPTFRIKANANITNIAFAYGNSNNCRLPHRAHKRRCSILKDTNVSLILLGLSSGLIEVYNLDHLISKSTIASKFVLTDKYSLVYLLCVAPDASLRVGSVHQGGEIRLWDLWDDGNMYGKLDHKFTIPIQTKVGSESNSMDEIQCEACTFAWQPHGNHIFLGGQRGHGVILEAERPFSRIACIRSGHYHRISVANYSHDGSLLITASYDSSCAVWSVPEYQCLHRYWHMDSEPSLALLGGSNGHHLYGLAISPDDLALVTICEDRCIRLWPIAAVTKPLKTYSELAVPEISGPKLRSVAFSSCGRLIAVSTADHQVLMFTNPSEFLKLSNQCTRLLRYTVMKHILCDQSSNHQIQKLLINKDHIMISYQHTIFYQNILQLCLPYSLKQIILKKFF